MAILKKKKVIPEEKLSKVTELMKKISDIDTEIHKKYEEREVLERELLEVKISPFKLGDYVMAEVNAGKTKKVQKCLLENDGSTLFVRPVKSDGELSNRHFSVIPVPGKDYSDFLKPVEE